MHSTEHTQSLSDFRQNANETLDRLNRTGEAEVITVNGEARAVLIAPAVYDEMARARELEIAYDAAAIRRAIKQFEEGKGMSVDAAHELLRKELLAMKSVPDASK